MDKLKWCKKKGLELVEPNKNLSQEYLRKSENALRAVKTLDGNNEWQISSAYYAMYFAAYSILMKISIKSEIHDCTIELTKTILNKYFTNEETKLLKKAFKARIDSQYYTDRTVDEELRKTMVNKAGTFHLKCREITTVMQNTEIDKIRKLIQNL